MEQQKKLIMFFMILGSSVGGFLPSLWSTELFSLTSVLLSALGGFLGIYVGYKLSR